MTRTAPSLAAAGASTSASSGGRSARSILRARCCGITASIRSGCAPTWNATPDRPAFPVRVVAGHHRSTASARRRLAKKAAASLDHRCVEAMIADIDVGQQQAGALQTVLTALLAYPRRCGVELGARGARVLRFRPSIASEIVAGEIDVAQKACPDGGSRQRRR